MAFRGTPLDLYTRDKFSEKHPPTYPGSYCFCSAEVPLEYCQSPGLSPRPYCGVSFALEVTASLHFVCLLQPLNSSPPYHETPDSVLDKQFPSSDRPPFDATSVTCHPTLNRLFRDPFVGTEPHLPPRPLLSPFQVTTVPASILNPPENEAFLRALLPVVQLFRHIFVLDKLDV
ncbi:hypothetical protein LZ30DRAFT_795016 [Colletotrichum cereale]|nr:hypothetical protein LZ30DRAFT_795016 [Colletotrichum cereale]